MMPRSRTGKEACRGIRPGGRLAQGHCRWKRVAAALGVTWTMALGAAAVATVLLTPGATYAQSPVPSLQTREVGGATADPAGSAPVLDVSSGISGTEVAPEAVAAIARNLNCPLCQGYNLQDCPLVVCAQMRDLIRQQLAAGQSSEQIMAGFVADYGPVVLNAPPTTGVFLTAWVLPGLILLAGAVVVALLLRRMKRAAAPRAAASGFGGDPAVEVDPEYASKLELLARDGDR